MPVVRTRTNVDVRLVPRQTKAAGKGRVVGAVGEEGTVLHRKQIERQTRLDAVEIQNQRVVQLAADYCRVSPRLLVEVSAQAIQRLRIWFEVETDLGRLFLRCRRNDGC